MPWLSSWCALEIVIDLFERLLNYCADRHAGVIFFSKRDGWFTKLRFLDGRVNDMDLLLATARALQIAITVFQRGAVAGPFQGRRPPACSCSQVEPFASECPAESVISLLGSFHILVILPI